MSDPPDNPPHNAETVADTGPRWNASTAFAKLHFIGRVGPLDLWLDADDPSIPFLIVYGPTHSQINWASDQERIIQRCQRERLHLTLHDECIIHQLCATHNNPTTMETHND